ncbi:MAG: hypothetical protein IT434_08350 [Phycisphaerales bacterium]|nr:hypothetical protein [Phycisphaerales bacterium]
MGKRVAPGEVFSRCNIKRAADFASIALGLVFVTFAFAKAAKPSATIESISAVMGVDWGARSFWPLIVCEVIWGAWLLSGWMQRRALLASTICLVIFLGWIGHLAWTGANASCGCGHVGIPFLQATSRGGEFARTGSFLIVSVIGLVASMMLNTSCDSRVEGSEAA